MKIFEEKGYRYEGYLSTGGEGEVHLIKSVDKSFVAKIIPRLGSEALKIINDISKMHIPNTPEIHEIFNHEDKTIIIRDYVEGVTLYEEVKKNGCFSYVRSKKIILTICETIKAFHSAKPQPIIYRDLKPENIIVMPNGDIRLIDFGIARYHKTESTRDTVLAGTKGYSAPEIMAGMQSDIRSDIYSIGMLLYELLTGHNILEPPYQIRPVAEANDHLPSWLDIIIQKATNIQPSNRYQCIDELISDIENPGRLKSRRKWGRRRIIAMACAALLLGGALYYLYAARAESYEVLLDLEFDDEEDQIWVAGSENPKNGFSFVNGQLHVEKNCCKIDFALRNGMIAHYKLKGSEAGAVALGQYRVNAPVNFECIYYNEDAKADYTTWGQDFYGIPIKPSGQFIDVLLYTTPGNDAVYAAVIDEETSRIAYTAYKIPDNMNNDSFNLEIYNFTNTGSDDMIIESVKVAEGSLAKYIRDNFSAYRVHKKRVDEFLQEDIDSLPEMVFKPANEW